MNIRKTLATLVATLVLVMTMLPSVAHASGFFDAVKDKADDAANYVRENGPGWVDSAKEGAENLYNAGKEKLPELQEKAKDGFNAVKDGVTTARDEFAEWNGQQPDIFWDWFEQQTGVTSTPAPEVTSYLTDIGEVGDIYEIPPEYRDTQTAAEPAPEPSYYVDADGRPLPFGVTPEMLEEFKDGNTAYYYNPEATTSEPAEVLDKVPIVGDVAAVAEAVQSDAPHVAEPAPVISDTAVALIVIGGVGVVALVCAAAIIIYRYKALFG